jgi:pSer/pThr/pTyr-binding forkhead associated (FHA) protein
MRSQYPQSATVIVQTGDLQGTKFWIRGNYLIGSHPENHIELEDSNVSRVHAVIAPTPNGYLMMDLNSRTGTYVNGMRILRTTLKDGDEIQVGSTRMQFEEESPIG